MVLYYSKEEIKELFKQKMKYAIQNKKFIYIFDEQTNK